MAAEERVIAASHEVGLGPVDDEDALGAASLVIAASLTALEPSSA